MISDLAGCGSGVRRARRTMLLIVAGSRWTLGPATRPIPPMASISPPTAPPAIAPMAGTVPFPPCKPPLRHPHCCAQGISRWHPTQPRDAGRRPLARRRRDRGTRRLLLRPTMTARDGDRAGGSPAASAGSDFAAATIGFPLRGRHGARRRHRRRCGRRNLCPLSAQGQQGRARSPSSSHSRATRRASTAILSRRLARAFASLTHGYGGLEAASVTPIPSAATAINPTAKTVRLESGETLSTTARRRPRD